MFASVNVATEFASSAISAPPELSVAVAGCSKLGSLLGFFRLGTKFAVDALACGLRTELCCRVMLDLPLELHCGGMFGLPLGSLLLFSSSSS